MELLDVLTIFAAGMVSGMVILFTARDGKLLRAWIETLHESEEER